MDQLYFSIVCDGCLGAVGRVCGVARLAVRANLFRFQILLIGVLVIAHNSLISILVRTGRVPAIEGRLLAKPNRNAMAAFAHRDLASRIHGRNAPKADKPEPTRMVESRCGAVAVGRTYLLSASFVWRCLSGSAMTPFPHPAHRTGQADLPHPALGQDFTP